MHCCIPNILQILGTQRPNRNNECRFAERINYYSTKCPNVSTSTGFFLHICDKHGHDIFGTQSKKPNALWFRDKSSDSAKCVPPTSQQRAGDVKNLQLHTVFVIETLQSTAEQALEETNTSLIGRDRNGFTS